MTLAGRPGPSLAAGGGDGAVEATGAEEAGEAVEGAEELARAVAADVRAIVERRASEPLDASVVPAAAAEELVRRHGLGSLEELALLALPAARAMSAAPISGYRIAAVGVETGGDLVLGANLEFPGTELGTTVHAEGFVPLRVRRRGRRLAVLALGAARPCAHCRQTLAERADAAALQLIDLDGNRRSLDDLYPLTFRPSALGVPEDDGVTVRWPGLAIDAAAAPPDIAAALLETGERAHAPYSQAPSAVALRLVDGWVVAAGCVESVAFNPTISAAQAALVELAAARAPGVDVAGAWLAKRAGAAVDPEPGFRALVGAVAPGAGVRVVEWRGLSGR